MLDTFKIVHFDEYCPKCVHIDKHGYEEPCNTCLECGARIETSRPVNFEDNGKDDKKKGAKKS